MRAEKSEKSRNGERKISETAAELEKRVGPAINDVKPVKFKIPKSCDAFSSLAVLLIHRYRRLPRI